LCCPTLPFFNSGGHPQTGGKKRDLAVSFFPFAESEPRVKGEGGKKREGGEGNLISFDSCNPLTEVVGRGKKEKAASGCCQDRGLGI